MRLKVWVAAGAVIVLGLVSLAGCKAAGVDAAAAQPVTVDVSNQQTGIWVSGAGKITVSPDMATLSLGVSTQASTVADAQSKVAVAMDKVMTALADNGVAKKDIQTNFFSIQQVTRYDDKTQTQIVVGYMVSNSVIAKLRVMDKVGSVIDAVASAGGDLTRINGISFSVENPQPFNQQVRELAMQDAKAKADQIARLSGVSLGKPTFVSDSSVSPIVSTSQAVRPGTSEGVAVPPTSISPGQIDITLNVQVAYAIQ